MSVHGTSQHFAAARQLVAFGGEADIDQRSQSRIRFCAKLRWLPAPASVLHPGLLAGFFQMPRLCVSATCFSIASRSYCACLDEIFF